MSKFEKVPPALTLGRVTSPLAHNINDHPLLHRVSLQGLVDEAIWQKELSRQISRWEGEGGYVCAAFIGCNASD